MSRAYTDAEKKAVKNLQVSNSIYRAEIKDLAAHMQVLGTKIKELEAKIPNLLGEEEAQAQRELVQLNADFAASAGKIKYKDGRIAEKEAKIEDIKNLAAREEEIVVKVWDPNSPEFQAKFAAANDEIEKKVNGRKNKSETPKKKKDDVTGGKLVNGGGMTVIDNREKQDKDEEVKAEF